PLAGIAGDQQAALFGQGCFRAGDVKATYGTGTFVLANVGALAGPIAPGLLKTAAATPAGTGATVQYAAEGSVLVGGAALQWLRADGGATANGFLMQLQADLIGVPVEVSADADATGLGAAALAGLAVGTWPDVDALVPLLRRGARYEPSLDAGEIGQARESWRH